MTPEKLVEALKKDLGDGLKSVILYGSAATGDHAGRRSDYNVLVVVERLGVPELKAMSRTAATWAGQGNPPPLLFTVERLAKSSDVFPIELTDMKEAHKVLHGEDVLADLKVSEENLRLELEHELKGKLIQLRERYLLTGGRAKRVAELMVRSLSTFLVLFRASLRLFEDNVPPKKLEALAALRKHVSFDEDVFRTIHRMKEGSARPPDPDVEPLFERYLQAVEAVVDAVDSHIRRSA